MLQRNLILVALLSTIKSTHCDAQVIVNHPIAAPSRLEVNLGPTPIDQYGSPNCRPGYTPKACAADITKRFIGACSSTSTVRQCYQSALQGYFSHSVTGVRFQFALCGGYYSTPLNGCGGNATSVTFDPSGTWRARLAELLTDIYNSGIRNITPTPVLSGWGDIGEITTEDAQLPAGKKKDLCGYGGANSSLRWFPALPFPYRTDGLPYGYTMSNAYSCGPRNDVNFVGWSNIYSVINALLASAALSSRPLVVEEIDMTNELLIADSTISARLIVDNDLPPPGRCTIRSQILHDGE